jgi:hypothetical protein
MQMPGAKRARRATPNVYTGLLLAAVAIMAGALVVVFLQASKVAPGSGLLDVLKLQDSDRVVLPDG